MTRVQLADDLRVIHEATRLRIMGLLYRETDLGFTTLRDTLQLTAGNLASHTARLQAAGFVATREALTRTGFEKRVQITPQGLSAFERYLDAVDAFVATVRVPGRPNRAAAESAEATTTSTPPQARPRAGRAAWGFVSVGLVFAAAEAAQLVLSGASGSDLVGIGLAGVFVTAVASVEHAVGRFARGRF